jgi:hypothetical protein
MSKKMSLLEAAAEILKGSQSSAPKEEMHKAEGEVQDLGGVTPTSAVAKKLEVGASKATPPGKSPNVAAEPLHTVANGGVEIDPFSIGNGTTPEEAEQKHRIDAGLSAGDLKEEEDKDDDKDDEDEDDEKDDDEKDEKDKEDWKKNLKEDVAKILASESTLPKEFAAKVGTIYEARVADKVQSIQEEIEALYEEKFTAAVLELRSELSEQVESYLNYVVEEWMKQNELAIEHGLRSELTEEFIGGLRNLFLENYIDIPSEKVDLVDELANKIEELTGSLNEEVARGIELTKKLAESKKSEILQSVCEGLTQTQVEKVRTLAESVEFTAEGEYKTKVSTIRENYYPVSTGKRADAALLTEASEPLVEEKAVNPDAGVASVVRALAQTTK